MRLRPSASLGSYSCAGPYSHYLIADGAFLETSFDISSAPSILTSPAFVSSLP